MKVRTALSIWVALVGLMALALISGHTTSSQPRDAVLRSLIAREMPHPPALHYSIYRTAPLIVAEVFGRAQGCSDATPELVEMTAQSALRAGLDPAIAAATVATESNCNNFAISSRGAIGLMQVRPSVWKDHYDFSGSVNLFNEESNVRVGSEIMARLIHDHGTAEGVQLYNGAGVGCPTCDAGYSARILALAHK